MMQAHTVVQTLWGFQHRNCAWLNNSISGNNFSTLQNESGFETLQRVEHGNVGLITRPQLTKVKKVVIHGWKK